MQEQDYHLCLAQFRPTRVKFFAWLLVQNMIQCKVNLANKGLLQDATYDMCKDQDEDADHIISKCTFTCSF